VSLKSFLFDSAKDKKNTQGSKNILKRLKEGLKKTQQGLIVKLDSLISRRKELSAELVEEIENLLISADLGITTVETLIKALKTKIGRKQIQSSDEIREFLKQELFEILHTSESPLVIPEHIRPFVIMTVGVNGSGKTTTIAKLAYRWKNQGYKVLLAAADTFRAAAIEQLEILANKVGCDIVKHHQKSDPASVAFDAIKVSQEKSFDVVLIDTAGRLHTKKPLMEELKKIKKVINKLIPHSPHEILLIMDATTGQNGLSQARIFKEDLGVTGIVLTKLDGTAKGGIIVPIVQSLNIPVKFIGIGEGLEDLREFIASDFVDALFDTSS